MNASVPVVKQVLNATAVAAVNGTMALAASGLLAPVASAVIANLSGDSSGSGAAASVPAITGGSLTAALPAPSSLGASHRIVSLSSEPKPNESEHSSDYHWAIGVVLAAAASVISNLGLNFQKLTHLKIADQDEHAKLNYYKDTVWMLGLLMVIIGSLADFAALAFGAQSIIAPLGSLTLVANVFFAPCLLGETLTKRDLFATLTIIVGATISVMFASHKDTIYEYVRCYL